MALQMLLGVSWVISDKAAENLPVQLCTGWALCSFFHDAMAPADRHNIFLAVTPCYSKCTTSFLRNPLLRLTTPRLTLPPITRSQHFDFSKFFFSSSHIYKPLQISQLQQIQMKPHIWEYINISKSKLYTMNWNWKPTLKTGLKC